MSEELYVEIVAIDGDEVVERMGPNARRRAEKIERDVLINLNHEDYYTRIVDKDGKPVNYFEEGDEDGETEDL